jgi:hypothetical protein
MDKNVNSVISVILLKFDICWYLLFLWWGGIGSTKLWPQGLAFDILNVPKDSKIEMICSNF